MAGAPDLDTLLGAPPDDLAGALPTRVLPTVVLRMLALVAHADGVLDPREVEFLVEVAATMDLDRAEARRVLDDELARRSDPEALARQIPPAEQRDVYALACMMALSEGDLAPAERDALAAFARGASHDPAAAAEILAEIVKRA